MKNILLQAQWGWKTSGIALGAIFLLAVAVIKPIGVSTQFVILDGIIWNAASGGKMTKVDSSAKKGYSSPNAYLNKSGGKYAKSVAKPVNYSFVFVLAMLGGGFLASRLQSKRTQEMSDSTVASCRLGNSKWARYAIAFLGGFLVLVGARLAGGCTSGHMMSGMMQTSISGYLFAAGAFAAAIPVALLIYKGGK